jgi:TolB protein
LVVAVTAILMLLPQSSTAAPRSATRGTIVFSRLERDGYRLYKMRTDGTGLTKLTDGPGDDIQTDISRDGRLVFAHGWGTFPRGPATRIYIRERDGKIRPLLEEFPGMPPMADYYPRWSPDGRRVTFTRANVGGELSVVSTNSAVYVVNADGSALRRVTEPNMSGLSTWSPDGRRIVFNAPTPSGRFGLYAIDVKARRPRPRMLSKGMDFHPDWSPDGRSIAFTSFRDGGSWQVYVMRSDGSRERRLTFTDGHQDRYPRWSPDGKNIVFDSTRDNDCPQNAGAACRPSRLYTMRSDGKGQKPITEGPADSYSAWSNKL